MAARFPPDHYANAYHYAKFLTPFGVVVCRRNIKVSTDLRRSRPTTTPNLEVGVVVRPNAKLSSILYRTTARLNRH